MLEHHTKCAETVEKGHHAVKFAFRFTETVKLFTATKVAAKGCESAHNLMGIC
jgi:hypothetical protein